MATTKIFPIRITEVASITYIADGEKTDNGRLIYTFGCDKNPIKARKDFAQIRSMGTGLSSVRSQHFIQNFPPCEIIPEQALKIGIELCDKFLKGEYQYYLAVHKDEHVHLHCIFNNANMFDGWTFKTQENQGNKQNRSWKKLMDLSDEIWIFGY